MKAIHTTFRQMTKFGLALALVAASSALANVSLKNGNFFIGYTDIIYSGGFEPKVERVYNSKSPYSTGMFGWGWGTEYEVYLNIQPDNSVIVHEYGGGAQNRFIPKGYSPSDLAKAVDAMVTVGKSTGLVGSPKQIEEFREKLTKDSVFRNSQWEKFVAAGKMKRSTLPAGAQLISTRFSYQYLTKVESGYKRVYDNGKMETFLEDGRLSQITDKNNNFIKFFYGKDGKLARLEDNFNRKMYFEFDNKGLISKITGDDGRSATYRYNDQRELVWSRDVDGNTYEFGYTKDQRHNMALIKYSDATTLEVAYYGREMKENVKSVKDRDGSVTEYSYGGAQGEAGTYWVELNIKDKKGKAISKSRYEYTDKVKASGEYWTQKMVSSVDGDTTITEYNEMALPVVIQRGKEVTKFSYDAKGRVLKKDTPFESTELEYHPNFGKVTSVRKKTKGDSKSEWSKFQYDGAGNLTYAENSDKRTVRLVYDRVGRIKSMVDQDKRVLNFKYNEHSKPTEIEDPKLGAIKVTYTATGEIKKVDSTAGRKIALQVTTAFQNLLDIIRPAGVTLSF